jgi:hypothetical protein
MIRDWETYVLSPRERRIARALAEALYVSPASRAGADPPLNEVLDGLEAWLGTPHATLRLAFRGLLFGLELSPIRFGFGARRMSVLSLEARVQYLERLDADDSAALHAWKSILGMAYFGQPAGAQHMALRGPTSRPLLSLVRRLVTGSPANESARGVGS